MPAEAQIDYLPSPSKLIERAWHATEGFFERLSHPDHLSKHFKRNDFACHCCKQLKLDENLVPALEKLFEVAKATEIEVHDAYRCEKHNKKVGGRPHSEHLEGKAADIVIKGKTLREMYDLAEKVPAFNNGGIGIYPGQGFIHVDVRSGKARWAFVGRKQISIEDGMKLLAH